MAQQILSFLAVALFVIGLVGNGFEMRKIRISTGDMVPKNVFLDKRNFKWYALIVIALGLWAISNYT